VMPLRVAPAAHANPSASQQMKSSCRVRLRRRKGASCKLQPRVPHALVAPRDCGGGEGSSMTKTVKGEPA